MSEKHKSWSDLSCDELKAVGHFIEHKCYSGVQLNMNDTFGYALAWGVDVDIYDIPALISLNQQFGHDGIVAWAAIKEKVDQPIKATNNFFSAKKHIEENMTKYFWIEEYRKNKP